MKTISVGTNRKSISIIALLLFLANTSSDIIRWDSITAFTATDNTHAFRSNLYTTNLYLPILSKPSNDYLRVNAPFFEGDVLLSQSAILWFGYISSSDNYVDVRVGYNSISLNVSVSVIDQYVWYDREPDPADLEQWDSISLFLDTNGNAGNSIGPTAFRFTGQVNSYPDQPREEWQAAYQGNGSDWELLQISFTTESFWRGNALNDNEESDDGWNLSFDIPFSSFGLANDPSQGSIWGIGLALNDRDDASESILPVKTWPDSLLSTEPETWGQLHFGLPAYSPPPATPKGSTTIRQSLDGISVTDGEVGGHTVCGKPYWEDIFDLWGNANYTGIDQINIQNQIDIADFACFSKFLVTFPLDTIPAGKAILSAAVTLHLWSNAGRTDPPPENPPGPSLIQALILENGWDEATLTWNNTPFVKENVGGTWVYPIDTPPGEPGIPYVWDVSLSVSQAYKAQQPLRLAFYSADTAQNSGKYFYSSDTLDWNWEARPSLEVTWGDPD